MEHYTRASSERSAYARTRILIRPSSPFLNELELNSRILVPCSRPRFPVLVQRDAPVSMVR
ncbi:hypothetical protein AG1IA_05296 [Rhizoctonia solani AG-1 IA]|uniref:Uncharacterized protein n=1 Tax=Thanatephorus cucumeris (strain AG1-IA) TaxID=983506 RepID=L8WRQ8_THACA|nr:hypothetical protein AG1IA_05296 [Rhizoctonia solani AG-1 IA]